ncbi:GFA family protein [Paracoccaceae bacterium]|nr:GFA family protein [Paracoccaceae bacterium]
MVKLSGGCLCGSIRYTILQQPILAYTCNCRFCQKDTGTAYRSALSILNENVELIGRNFSVYTYKSVEHGRELYKNFCPDCGTTISLKTERFPERQVIMIGTLDDPSQIELSTHMFAEEAFDWVEFPKDHVVYPRHRINDDGTTASPIE